MVRRYSDFTWLSLQLSRSCPGSIVPAIPEKQIVGKFNSDFVESRRRSLERFLTRIASHPELGKNESFVLFLQGDEGALKSAMEATKSPASKRLSAGLSWINDTANQLANSGKMAQVETSSSDNKIEEIHQSIAAMERQMQSIAKHAESLVKRSKEMSHALDEFGQSFTALGVSEGGEALGTALTQIGTAVDLISVSGTEHAEAEVLRLQEPLEEYVRMIGSVKAAMAVRQDRKGAYVAILTDLAVKQAAYEKLLGTPGKEEQASAKKEAVKVAEASAEGAKVEFEQVTKRLLDDFERFKSQKAADIQEILLNFVNLQIDFNRKSEQMWKDMLPVLSTVATNIARPSQSSNTNPMATSNNGMGRSSVGGSNPFGDYSAASSAPASSSSTQPAKDPFQESDVNEEDMVGV